VSVCEENSPHQVPSGSLSKTHSACANTEQIPPFLTCSLIACDALLVLSPVSGESDPQLLIEDKNPMGRSTSSTAGPRTYHTWMETVVIGGTCLAAQTRAMAGNSPGSK